MGAYKKDIHTNLRLHSELDPLGEKIGLVLNETVLENEELVQKNCFDQSLPNFYEINHVIYKETMILVTNRYGVIIYLNEKCSDTLGFYPNELLGENTRIFKTNLHSSDFYQDLWETVNSGQVWRGEISSKRKDGSIGWYFMSIFPLLNDDHEPYQFLTVRFDITQQKEYEKWNLLKDKQLDSYIEVMLNVVIGSIDEMGNIINVSPSVEKVIGYTPAELIGLHMSDYIIPESLPNFVEAMRKFKKTPESVTSGEIVIRHKNNTTISCAYTAKNYLHDHLLKAIVFKFGDISEQKRLNQEIRNIGYYDALTGLPNMRYLEERLESDIESAKESFKSLAIIQAGLDDFRYVNSTFGHHSGDQLLKEFSNRIKNVLSDPASIHRISGDVFIILLKDIENLDHIHKFLRHLITLANNEPVLLEGNEIYTSISVGVSIFPYSGESQEALLKNAEIAMYGAKHNGKNQYQIFSPTMNLYSYKQYILRNDSRKALQRNEFCVFYQPRINPKTNEMVSAEALIRWEHPKWGMVFPDEFIHMAEDSGLIIPIGEWMIRKICYEIKRWEKENYWLKKVSINLSSLQLLQPNFAEMVSSILQETHVEPKWIEFEITESVFIEKEEQVLNTLNQLRNLGIKISLDDFGTGYSSLNYLKKIPCQTIKIDKSLVNGIQQDQDNLEIIASIISLCHKLKKTVVAEGVEYEEQLSILKTLDCDEIQGYLFSKPINEKEYTRFLREGKMFKAEKSFIEPNVNRRKFTRFSPAFPLMAEVTIEKIGNKKINIGNSEVIIKNISRGGMCFSTSSKMPVSKEIMLLFMIKITSMMEKLKGQIVWEVEKENHYFEYGVKFFHHITDHEKLKKLVNHIQLEAEEKSLLPR